MPGSDRAPPFPDWCPVSLRRNQVPAGRSRDSAAWFFPSRWGRQCRAGRRARCGSKNPARQRAAIGFRNGFRFDNSRPGFICVRNRKPHTPRSLSLLAARATQITELGHAALIALAPRGDAIPHPIQLPRDFAIEFVRVAFFLLEHLVAPRLIGSESPLQTPCGAAVEPKRGTGEI